MGPHGDQPGRLAGGTPEPLRDISPDKYTRVKGLYGRVLTEDQIRQIAMIETEYDDKVRPWEVYPGIGPNPFIYARRQRTVMIALVARGIAEIAVKIQDWVTEHEHDVDWSRP
jgi:hypothetical protein